jgi:hypothetical protein
VTKHIAAPPPAPAAAQEDDTGSRIATVAAIAVGAALIEVELIPGILIGIGAMLAPRFFPQLGNALRPLVKTVVRAGYALADKTKELAAETHEQFQDIVAEVKSEHAHARTAGADSHSRRA